MFLFLTRPIFLCDWVAYSSLDDSDSFVDGPMKFGRFVSVVGSVFGWVLWLMLAALLYVRVPKQDMLLKVIGISGGVMAVASLLLFVGISSPLCSVGTCSPTGVSAAIPAFIFFVASTVLMNYFQRTNKIPL
jgi:hypothetical protein